jgi:hypothetical protein
MGYIKVDLEEIGWAGIMGRYEYGDEPSGCRDDRTCLTGEHLLAAGQRRWSMQLRYERQSAHTTTFEDWSAAGARQNRRLGTKQ